VRISKSTYFLFGVTVTIMTLSVTVFTGGENSNSAQQNRSSRTPSLYEKRERYPIAEANEVEPSDLLKKAKLKKQKQRYDKDAPFTRPGPQDEELAFRPEAQFDFPALPIAKSDVILVGQVLQAQAHRSENKLNVFSNFDVRIDEVLKGSNLSVGRIVTVQRIGGFVKYEDGRKVLFRLSGNGMPAVGARYAFFLTAVDEDYSLLTAYEFGADGVMPLDNSRQFETYQGQTESVFLKILHDSIAQTVPR